MSKQNGASTTVNQMADDAKQFAREAYTQAETVRKDAVKQLFQKADELREQARALNGDARDNVNTVARNLERTANDLSSRAVDRAEDVTTQAKNNVWKTLLGIFVVGLLVGWWLGRD